MRMTFDQTRLENVCGMRRLNVDDIRDATSGRESV
jgi:hypothetical protein